MASERRSVQVHTAVGYLFGSLYFPGAYNCQVLHANAVVRAETALHFTTGHAAKSAKYPTISSQIPELRRLIDADQTSHTIYYRAARGQIPLVNHTGNKDILAQMIHLKNSSPSLNLIFMGGTESHTLKAQLAAASIAVIFAPANCNPFTWDVRNCLLGSHLTHATAVSTLLDAGVKIALGNWDERDRYLLNAIWEASWAAGLGNEKIAFDMVSGDVDEEVFGLRPTEDWVLYSCRPFEFEASVAVVFEEGVVDWMWSDYATTIVVYRSVGK